MTPTPKRTTRIGALLLMRAPKAPTRNRFFPLKLETLLRGRHPSGTRASLALEAKKVPHHVWLGFGAGREGRALDEPPRVL